MKLHKVEMYIFDFEDTGRDEILLQLEYSNFPYVFAVKEQGTADIGEWSDDHILNQMSTPVEEFRKHFE